MLPRMPYHIKEDDVMRNGSCGERNQSLVRARIWALVKARMGQNPTSPHKRDRELDGPRWVVTVPSNI